MVAFDPGLASSHRHERTASPFDFDFSDDRRYEALTDTLNRVRRHGSSITDARFSTAIRDGVKVGRGVVKESDFPLAQVLIGGGLLVLALTGVGLAAAATAGLAGAALITGTLSAFGPGGMVGGLAAIATLTGLGAAATGIGLGAGAAEEERVEERSRRVVVEQLVELSLGGMKIAVASVLAVVEAQKRLELKSTALDVEAMLASALDIDIARHRYSVHDAVTPGRPGANEWRKKVELLERALDWLRKEHLAQDPLHQAQEESSECRIV